MDNRTGAPKGRAAGAIRPCEAAGRKEAAAIGGSLITKGNDMRKPGYFIAAAATLAITVPAHAAGAQYNGAGSTRSGDIAGARPFASGVKLAYSYTRGGGIDRSVGVLTFTNPSTGLYCIQPTTPLKLAKIYPLVSIEFNNSQGEALQAFWRDTSAGSECPQGALEVQTWDISQSVPDGQGGSVIVPARTSAVAFDIVVP